MTITNTKADATPITPGCAGAQGGSHERGLCVGAGKGYQQGEMVGLESGQGVKQETYEEYLARKREGRRARRRRYRANKKARRNAV